MSECTETERAMLDAIHSGANVWEARIALTAERVRRDHPDLVGELPQRRREAERARKALEDCYSRLMSAIGSRDEFAGRVIDALGGDAAREAVP